jgi:hypothetical protein
MKDYDAATLNYLQARAGIVSKRLIWIRAQNRATGDFEDLALWSGLRDRAFTVDGVTRTYNGAGAVLDAEPVLSGPGLAVRTYQIGLAAVAPEVEDLVKGYKTRGAPVAVHRALFHADTRALVAPPRRVWLGRVDEIDFSDGEIDGTAACIMSLVSETRALTRFLSTVKSHVSQKLRGGDKLRRYADISGAVPIYWGEKRAG